MRAILAVLVLALLTIAARADDVTEIPGLVRQTLRLPLTDQAAPSLEALVIRPEGAGPFPLALMTHGLPRSAAEVPLMRPQTYTSPAIGFAQRGYAAVIVMRRGYGHSTGAFSETLGPCDDRNYVRAGRAASVDVLAALADLRKESWVDPMRVVLVGHSMGGFAVLAAVAGDPPDGVLGVISFAGAVGSPRPDFICQPDRLIEAGEIFGRTSRIPSLWIFAENDHYFGPGLVRDLLGAYVSNAAPASLFAAPRFGNDGHMLIFAADQTVWWPSVSAFLEKLGLPTRIQVALPPLRHLAAPVPLNEEGRTAFAAYKSSRSYEKAFAVDHTGHFGMALGQRTKASAEQAALRNCPRTETTCVVYANGNELVPVDGK